MTTSFAFSQVKVITNGNVGVGGVSNPAYELTVSGATYSTGGFLSPNTAGGVISKMQTFGNNTLARTQFRPETANKAQGFYLSNNGSGSVAGSTTFFSCFGSDFGADAVNWSIMQMQAGPTQNGINMRNNGTGTLGDFYLMQNYAEKFTMTAGGKFGFGTTSPDASVLVDVKGAIGYNGTLVNTSDKRLKKDVNKFQYGLDEVLALNTIYYKYNGEAGTDSENTHVGIMAQDLREVAPKLVGEWTYQAPEFVYVQDQDGDEFPSKVKNAQRKAPETYLNIQESAIKYMLINAVQDQQDIIEDQQSQIDELRSTLADLAELVENVSLGNSTTIHNTEVNLENYTKAELAQNQPNPFNGSTQIGYVIPTDASTASINIFDMNGTMIKSIKLDHVGEGVLTVNALNIPSGNYAYTLVIDGNVSKTKKMVLTK